MAHLSHPKRLRYTIIAIIHSLVKLTRKRAGHEWWVSNVEIRPSKSCNVCGHRANYVVEHNACRFYRTRVCWRDLSEEAVSWLAAFGPFGAVGDT